MKETIAQYCPWMKLSISEYNWGNDDIQSGALATAEVLAIFGKYGVDMATVWTAPTPGSWQEDAFKLFLDYDGAGSSLLDGVSVNASSPDNDIVSIYGIDTPQNNRLNLLLFNKNATVGGNSVSIQLSNLTPASSIVKLYGFDRTNRLGALPDATLDMNTMNLSLNTSFYSAVLAVVEYQNSAPGLGKPGVGAPSHSVNAGSHGVNAGSHHSGSILKALNSHANNSASLPTVLSILALSIAFLAFIFTL